MKIGFWQLSTIVWLGLLCSALLVATDLELGVDFLGPTGWFMHFVLSVFNILVGFARKISLLQVPHIRHSLTSQTHRMLIMDRGRAITSILVMVAFTAFVIFKQPEARCLMQFFTAFSGNQLAVIAFFTPWLFKPSCALVNRFVEIKEKPRAT